MLKQIFGDSSNDPRAPEPGKSPLAAQSRGPRENEASQVEPVRRPYEEVVPSPASLPETRQSVPLVSETIRLRREELEKQLEVTKRVHSLSQRRAADLTVDELMDLWQNL